MNELSIIFYKMNINTREVLEAASTKWNCDVLSGINA
jgi:UDP-N-acetyl-D-mannosaminuronate dehydrogenase